MSKDRELVPRFSIEVRQELKNGRLTVESFHLMLMQKGSPEWAYVRMLTREQVEALVRDIKAYVIPPVPQWDSWVTAED